MFCLCQCVELSDIHQLNVGFHISFYIMCGTLLQIEVDDAELVGPTVHLAKHPWRKHMYSGEGIHTTLFRGKVCVWTFHLPCLYVCPSHKTHVVITEQIAFRGSPAHAQQGIHCCILICPHCVSSPDCQHQKEWLHALCLLRCREDRTSHR